MMFWIFAALMTAGAILALALPLLRGRARATDAAEYDIEVYRDQIAELERDHDRGLVTDDEMEAARTEIARRMLAADAHLREKAGEARAPGNAGRIAAAVLTVALPVVAVVFYLEVGSPGAPDMPLAQRTDLPSRGQEDERVRQQITALTREAEANPADAETWLQLASAYTTVEMFGDAVSAYRKAISLGPVSDDVEADFAETLIMAAQGTVTPEARTIFEAQLKKSPQDPRSQYYLGLADYQAGKTQEALDRWASLVAASPADAPWLAIVRQNLARAANDLGLDVAKVTPDPLPARGGGAGAPQLTPEQRAQMESMTPEERQAMIRQMVDGLDAKLRDNPMDLAGWQRLIRARVVLGEHDAAQDALRRALEAFSGAPVPTGRLMDLAGELNLEVPKDAVQAPNIAEMVQGLAARLKDNPDDLQGWTMLARSYSVLGKPDQAREAVENAVRLAPDDPDVLTLQARIIREANGGKESDETTAILRHVLKIDPKNIEALWFVANAEADAGNIDKAREMLQQLLEQIPEDNPDREFVKKRIQQLGG